MATLLYRHTYFFYMLPAYWFVRWIMYALCAFVRIVGYRYMSPKHDPTAAVEAQGGGDLRASERERENTHIYNTYTCKI